jgi:hypothetical protein
MDSGRGPRTGHEEHAGHAVVGVDAGRVRLYATVARGPRIIGLVLPDGRDLMAHLPDATLPCPGSADFHLLGGHRLWAAPEVPALTYRPDDEPVSVSRVDGGVRLAAPVDPVAGTQRAMTIRPDGDGRARVGHAIANASDRPLALAPWAITLVPHGGRAWLPLSARPLDDGFQAERNIVLWPYTSLDDPRLVLSERLIEVRTDTPAGRAHEARLKVGTSLRRGWVAWWGDGALLVKRARHDEDARHADLGATGQVYANAFSMELETQGPLVELAPGATVEHEERWEVHDVDERTAAEMVRSGALDEDG